MTPKFLVLALLAVAFSGCVDELPGLEPSHEHADGASHGHGEESHADAGHEVGHEAMDGHDMHAQTGMERPFFGVAKGRVPTAQEAADFEQVSSIRIVGDEGFRPAAYISSGAGTMGDPYVIERIYVAGDLWLQDTDACFEVREVYIGGQLSLNWNGICAWVHHSYIHDLRVNENIARDGYATGGIIEHNKIGFIGQLRHYDGEFRHNEVGPRPATAPFDPILETTPLLAQNLLVANIDGFNQGLIHHNTFHGSVDLDFHGHHHGTGFFAPHSHYHGDNKSRGMDHDHTKRWTSVQFTDNIIIDHEGYGLRYDDRNHRGDDRVANSEQEETLDLDHVHRTQIDILRNTIKGSGIWVDIFNADDQKHKERNDGWLHIQDNTIELQHRDTGPFGLMGANYDWHIGLQLDVVKEAEILVHGNTFRFESGTASGPAAMFTPAPDAIAIEVRTLKDSWLSIQDNQATGFDVGVHGLRWSDVDWTWSSNDWGLATELRADDSVPMPN
ncbi:MAG: hypothetical protein ACPHID_05355 [Thermoplasmatota archaeon]